MLLHHVPEEGRAIRPDQDRRALMAAPIHGDGARRGDLAQRVGVLAHGRVSFDAPPFCILVDTG
jgi:hypothetical protein